MTRLLESSAIQSTKQDSRALKLVTNVQKPAAAFPEIYALGGLLGGETSAKRTRQRLYSHAEQQLISHSSQPPTKNMPTARQTPLTIRKRSPNRAGSQHSFSRKNPESPQSGLRSINHHAETVAAVIEGVKPQAHHKGGSNPSLTIAQPMSGGQLQRSDAFMTVATADAMMGVNDTAMRYEQETAILEIGSQFHGQQFPSSLSYDLPLTVGCWRDQLANRVTARDTIRNRRQALIR